MDTPVASLRSNTMVRASAPGGAVARAGCPVPPWPPRRTGAAVQPPPTPFWYVVTMLVVPASRYSTSSEPSWFFVTVGGLAGTTPASFGSEPASTREPFALFWRQCRIPVVVAAKISIRPSSPRSAATVSWMSAPPPRSVHDDAQLPPALFCLRPQSPPPPSLTNTQRLPLAFIATVGTPICSGSPPSEMFGLPRSVHDVAQAPFAAVCLMVTTWWSVRRRANTWSVPFVLVIADTPGTTGPPVPPSTLGPAQVPSGASQYVLTTPLRTRNACGLPAPLRPTHWVPRGQRTYCRVSQSNGCDCGSNGAYTSW